MVNARSTRAVLFPVTWPPALLLLATSAIAQGRPDIQLAFGGHAGPVYEVAHSPDGSLIASAGFDYAVKVWNAANGQLLRTLYHDSVVEAVAFSHDGQWLATGDWNDNAFLWRVVDGELVRSFVGHTNHVGAVAFSPNDQWLATAGNDGTARVWRVSDGTMVTSVSHGLRIHKVGFSPDGQYLATAGFGNNNIRLWRTSDWMLERSLTGHTSAIYALTFSPNGEWIASGAIDQTIRIWVPTSSSAVRVLTGHTSTVNGVAFAPDNTTLISGSFDRTVRKWNSNTGQLLDTWSGHSDIIWSVALSPDGSVASSVGADAAVRTWNTADGSSLWSAANPEVYGPFGILFAPDGQTFLTNSGNLRRWNLDGSPAPGLQDPAGGSATFSPDGSYLVATSGDVVKLWDAGSGDLLDTLVGHPRPANAVHISPDGTTLFSACEGPSKGKGGSVSPSELRRWSIPAGSPASHDVLIDEAIVTAEAVSPDGQVIAVGSADGSILLRSAADLSPITELNEHTTTVALLAFVDSGARLVSADHDGSVRFWSTDNWQPTGAFTINAFYDVELSPDARVLLTTHGDRTLRFWRLGDGAPLAHYDEEIGRYSSIAYQPQGGLIGIVRDGMTLLIRNPLLPGDMNCDGVVTVGDIGGFVLALTDPAQYAIDFPSCNINNADVNDDTAVTVSDIGPFVALLTGG